MKDIGIEWTLASMRKRGEMCPPIIYKDEKNGTAYWHEPSFSVDPFDGGLASAAIFADGSVDWDNVVLVKDFDEPLSAEKLVAIEHAVYRPIEIKLFEAVYEPISHEKYSIYYLNGKTPRGGINSMGVCSKCGSNEFIAPSKRNLGKNPYHTLTCKNCKHEVHIVWSV